MIHENSNVLKKNQVNSHYLILNYDGPDMRPLHMYSHVCTVDHKLKKITDFNVLYRNPKL